MSTNFNPTPKNLPVTLTKIVGNQGDEEIATGRGKPPVFTAEPQQSAQLVIDGKDRNQFMTPFSFVANIGGNLFRARMAKVSKIVMPKPPNITKFNNVLSFRQFNLVVNTTFTITIPPGYYTTTALSNAVANLMTAITPVPSTYAMSFDITRRGFNVTYTEAGSPGASFYFIESSSFIIRGKNLAPFRSFADGLDAGAIGLTVQPSNVAGMLYTRYAVVSSCSFNRFSYGDSRMSTNLLNNNIIATIDITAVYTPDDFDMCVEYSGVFFTTKTPESPRLMVSNPQRNLDPKVDIFVQDEYGENFNELFDLGSAFPANELGVSVFLEVTFM